MDFAFDEDQEEFRRTLRRFLEERSPMTEVRRLMVSPEGFDPAVWQAMTGQLGLPGVIVPEEYGGQGFSFLELVIVFEELGRTLAPSPYLGTMTAIIALLETASAEQKQALLPALASGEKTATLAFAEPGAGWSAGGIAAVATGESTVSLSGSKSYVVDGNTADQIVVAARRPGTTGTDGIVLALVDGAAAGLTKTPLETLDMTRRLARLDLAGVEGTVLAESSWPTVSTALDKIFVILAAEMVGGAQKSLDRAVAYAKERVQFARPIGSFQAIKHRCADMMVEVESAKAAAYYAGWAATEDNDELPVVAALAKAYASQAYVYTAAETLQVHGGIGFTWEDDSHLYLRRAKSSELLFGDGSVHRELMAQRLGI